MYGAQVVIWGRKLDVRYGDCHMELMRGFLVALTPDNIVPRPSISAAAAKPVNPWINAIKLQVYT